jgi:hypothetical protein
VRKLAIAQSQSRNEAMENETYAYRSQRRFNLDAMTTSILILKRGTIRCDDPTCFTLALFVEGIRHVVIPSMGFMSFM